MFCIVASLTSLRQLETFSNEQTALKIRDFRTCLQLLGRKFLVHLRGAPKIPTHFIYSFFSETKFHSEAWSSRLKRASSRRSQRMIQEWIKMDLEVLRVKNGHQPFGIPDWSNCFCFKMKFRPWKTGSNCLFGFTCSRVTIQNWTMTPNETHEHHERWLVA